jgi:hypothetical protein
MGSEDSTANPASEPPTLDAPESRGLPLPTTAKEKRTAEELAAMIHRSICIESAIEVLGDVADPNADPACGLSEPPAD